jgi:DNA modification methylase
MIIEKVSDGVTLYNADCRDVLPTLGKVDAVVTDPPYGINENDKKIASRGTAVVPARDYGEMSWDKEPISAECVAMLLAASKWQIIFGGNYFQGLGPTPCWLVWDKVNGKTDFADCELAWTNLPKAVRIFRWMWNGMLRQGDSITRQHPTQKPVQVMEWCIGQLPDDVHSIIDPFMGSGTTGVAAAGLGKKFIGIEREPKYFDIACKRISEAVKQPGLF